jgi:molecular chaperone GrpE
MRKLLPTIDTLRTSIDHIPEEQKESQFAQGILLTYNKMIDTLTGLGVHENPGIGNEVDSFLHEPMGTKPTEQEEQKGKIVEEYQKGYYYEKDGEKSVIITSKVVIGQ